MKRLSLPLLLSLLVSCHTPAFALTWESSLEAARSRAAAEGKHVLALVYGTEFTRRRMQMREHIMDDERFCDYAEDKFVPVEMVEPADRVNEAAAIWKHRGFCLEYGIKRWPTTLVMRPDGIVTGGLVGVPGQGLLPDEDDENEPIDTVCNALDNGLLVSEKLREAEAIAEPQARLQAMAAAYALMEPRPLARLQLARYIGEQDPEGITGLMDEYLDIKQMIEWGEIGRYGMDRATSLRRMQEMLDAARPANRLEMLRQRYNFQSRSLHTVEDMELHARVVREYAEELEKTDPVEADALRREHDMLYGDDPVEALRRKQERARLRERNYVQ